MTLRLSAHIGYLFTGLPLADRVAAARQAGFSLVEHPAPFQLPAAEWRRILDGEGMAFAQMSSGTGGEGMKGCACLEGQEDRFLKDWLFALDFAEEIGCPLVHPMAGISAGETASRTYRSNVERAIGAALSRKVMVLIEVIGRGAVPGYHIHTLARLEAELSGLETSFTVLLDTFHCAENGEDAAAFIRHGRFRIGHIHVADHPGRGEPGTGTVDFALLRAAIIEDAYEGAIGFECHPIRPVQEWIGAWRA